MRSFFRWSVLMIVAAASSFLNAPVFAEDIVYTNEKLLKETASTVVSGAVAVPAPQQATAVQNPRPVGQTATASGRSKAAKQPGGQKAQAFARKLQGNRGRQSSQTSRAPQARQSGTSSKSTGRSTTSGSSSRNRTSQTGTNQGNVSGSSASNQTCQVKS